MWGPAGYNELYLKSNRKSFEGMKEEDRLVKGGSGQRVK